MHRQALIVSSLWGIVMACQSLVASPAWACNRVIKVCDTNGGGLEIGATTTWGLPLQTSEGGPTKTWVYGSSTMCTGDHRKEPGHDDLCGQALTYCATLRFPPDRGGIHNED